MKPERLEELKANCTNPHAMVFMNVEEILWLIAEVERLRGVREAINTLDSKTLGDVYDMANCLHDIRLSLKDTP
jgi:hypothetical protein